MARLSFIDADAPGYTRRRIDEKRRRKAPGAASANIWEYRDYKGEVVTSRAVINRLNRIGLPPAYHDAWFARDPNAHIQATGIDERVASSIAIIRTSSRSEPNPNMLPVPNSARRCPD